MVLTYPLAGLFRLIPTSLPTLRHITGITLGLAIGLFCFGQFVVVLHVERAQIDSLTAAKWCTP